MSSLINRDFISVYSYLPSLPSPFYPASEFSLFLSWKTHLQQLDSCKPDLGSRLPLRTTIPFVITLIVPYVRCTAPDTVRVLRYEFFSQDFFLPKAIMLTQLPHSPHNDSNKKKDFLHSVLYLKACLKNRSYTHVFVDIYIFSQKMSYLTDGKQLYR